MLDELRLLAIAGPPVLPVSRLTDACRAAEAGGVTAIQLRVKGATAGSLLGWTEELCATLTIPVYVNDRADVALIGKATGVHVGADDIPPAAVRELAGHALRVGVSVGNAVEADAARRDDVDYWSIGSVFGTETKPDAGAAIGVQGFRDLASRAPEAMTVLAIGGIARENLAEVLVAGAHGVAVSRAVFGSRHIERAARALRAAIDDALTH
jgi:thiamine-phosphate diphosphorylase